MRTILAAFLLVFGVVFEAAGQTAVTAERIYLGATQCLMRTGSGAPSGGSACEFYLDTAAGHVWINVGGTWINVSTTVAVPRGGTGQTALTVNGVLYGGGTAPIGVTAAPAPNSVLAVASGVPAFSTTPTVGALTATSSLSTPVVTSSASLRLAPAGSVVLDPASRTVVPGSNFGVSLGAPEQKFLALHLGELWAETLVAQDVLATIGGRVMVAPTTLLTADLAPGATAITVKHNNLAAGDRVYLQAAPGGVPQIEWLAVTSAASGSPGAYVYQVTRNLDGSGANQWYSGDAVLNTGQAGKGSIDLYALSGVLTGYGPTIVGNVRTGPAYNAIAPRWALGNLNGVGYGHTQDIYGIAAGDPAGAHFFADNTYGVAMKYGSQIKMLLDPQGNASFTGAITAASGTIGGWTINADSLYSGTGAQIAGMYTGTASTVRFFAGGDGGGTTPFRVYASGAMIASNVDVTGKITATEGSFTGNGGGITNINGGNIQAGTIGANKLLIGAANGAALNDDPSTSDQSAWTGGTIYDLGASGKVGRYVLRGNTSAIAEAVRHVPVDPNKTYRFHVWIYRDNGDGVIYSGVSMWDYAGNSVDAGGNVPSGGSLWFYCVSGVATTNGAWIEYSCPFGAGTGKPIPAVGRTMAPHVLANYGGSAGFYYVQDLRIEEMTPSTLIQDGAITTGKIQARSITADRIVAGAITATEIGARSITADRIVAASLTSTEIAARAITADRIVAGALTATEIAANTIVGGNIAGATITGSNIAGSTITGGNIAANTITGGHIQANTISADKLSVGSLSAISANLGTVTAGTISGNTIVGGSISGTTITGSTINAGGGNGVQLDNGGMTLGDGGGAAEARIKFSGNAVQLWGNSGGTIINSGNMDIYGGFTHVYGRLQVDSYTETSGYVRVGGELYFRNNNNTVRWDGGGAPPLGTGGTMLYSAGCTCLVLTSSSLRYKENVREWRPDNPFAILSMPLYRFDLRSDLPNVIPSKGNIGLIAEELYKAAPEAVFLDARGEPNRINDQTLTAYLIAALRAVNDRVARTEALELRIAELERRLAAAEAAAARAGGRK